VVASLTLSTDQRLTLADYLAYSDGTDTPYELVQGELVSMPLGTGLHGDISDFLNTKFQTSRI